jgi:hypothetical protein
MFLTLSNLPLSFSVPILELYHTELRMERAHQKERAQKARKTKANIELSKRTTVDDLTQGIVNYKYLGLDFEKAENERLRYVALILLDF